MAKRMNSEGSNTLRILNILMSTEGYITTQQIKSRLDCDRKTVYRAMDMLETHGFSVDVVQEKPGGTCKYKYVGLFGL